MKRKRKLWTKEELDFLIKAYPEVKTEHLASFLDRSLSSVYDKANLFKLQKSEQFLESEYSGRLLKDAGKRYRFKPGHKPWNKGKKGLQHGGIETQFKKGNRPHNTKEDGSISIRTDSKGFKYKYIRISLGKWVELHRHIWIQHNGPIPEGHIIVFKDGDSMNCKIENLEMITYEENMARNTIRRYPDEVASTIMAVNKLIKTIKKNEK